MALTNAERQRRYRERKRAERQESGAVTPAVTETETRNSVTRTPDLGARGRRLWQQVVEESPGLSPREQVLLEEACRTVDRLDGLDRVLRGDDCMWLHSANEDGSVVKVVLNNALAEARQQQTTLARLLAELRHSRAASVAGGNPPRRVGAGVSGPPKPGAAPPLVG